MAGRRDGELLFGSKRFALLYNVQGLRYTIGRQFECRKCQGEYLFCEGDGVAESSHCEITCCGIEGQFWVKDLQGSAGRGTFINGERIQSRTELKFGDYLSLGGHVPTTSQSDADHAKKVNSDYAKLWVENRNNAADGCTVFLFQAVKTSADSVEVESQSEDGNNVDLMFGQGHPLKNSLVLSNIFSYLPLRDVKKCRLVCSDWNEEAVKLLKNDAVVEFKYPASGYSIRRSQLFSFVHEMGQFFREGRFRITFPDNPVNPCHCDCCGCYREDIISTTTVDIPSWSPEQKMHSDMKWFFDMDEGFPHPVKKLSLDGGVQYKSGRILFLSVLQGVSLHLEEFELETILNLTNDDNSNPQPFDITFPSLKKMSVSIQIFGSCEECGLSTRLAYNDWDFDFKNKTKKWMTSMITAAPNLESLKLAADHVRGGFPQSFLSLVIEKKGFQNLNSLHLYTYNTSILESIIKLPNLISLTLGVSQNRGELDDSDDDDEDAIMAPCAVLLRNVLEKSANNLKYLDLSLFFPTEDTIQFPVLPKLKVLKLKRFDSYCISLSSGSELGLTFTDHFPILETFCVDVVNMHAPQSEKDFFNTFFHRLGDDEDEDGSSSDDNGLDSKKSKLVTSFRCSQKDEDEVVESVRWLEIENLQQWNPAALNRIGKLFPNAFNEHLEAAKAKALKLKRKKSRSKWKLSNFCK